MTRIFSLLAGLILSLALSAGSSPALPPVVLEQLKYDLTWSGIKAGTAELEVHDSGPYIQYISRARSTDFVSVFYRVEDLIVSSLVKDPAYQGILPGRPYNYRVMIKEGRHRRDKEIYFDFSKKQATFINHLGNEKVSMPISSGTMDALAAFHFVRRQPLTVGKSLFVEVFDSKKLYKMEVQVLKREEIATPLGTFKALLIRPVMLSEGIFSRKGDVLIWITDDEKRIPLMLKSKVKIGSVTATLIGGTF